DKNLNVRINYSRTSGTTPSDQEIAALSVAAKQSKTLTLDGIQGDPELTNSFTLSCDGAPGDLMAKLVAVADDGLREIELPGKDEKALVNGGNHPWSLENESESTLLLFNHSTLAQTVTVVVSSGQTVWQKSYDLASAQTSAIRLGSLIGDQVKDDKGQELP